MARARPPTNSRSVPSTIGVPLAHRSPLLSSPMTSAVRRPSSEVALDLAAPIASLVETAQRAEREARHADARAVYEAALRHPALPRAGLVASPASLLRWIARTL